MRELSSAPQLPDTDEKILGVGRKMLYMCFERVAVRRALLPGPSRRVRLFRLDLVHDTGSGCSLNACARSAPINSIRVMRSHFDSWESASKSGLAKKLDHLKFRHA
jgi:hypothetical protein